MTLATTKATKFVDI